MDNKALKLMKKAKSVDERSDKYAKRIKTDLHIDMILPLQKGIDKIDDEIFDLENFSLDTNLNKGQRTMTKDDCEERFKAIINLKYQRKILSIELEAKQGAFDDLFGTEVTADA